VNDLENQRIPAYIEAQPLWQGDLPQGGPGMRVRTFRLSADEARVLLPNCRPLRERRHLGFCGRGLRGHLSDSSVGDPGAQTGSTSGFPRSI
jgi:hypothetical protein